MGFSFTGLSAGQVLGLFSALGVATVALYLLKLRRRRVEVPFVRLWESVLADQKTTRLFSQLKRWLSLLLALGIVGALCVSLGDPRREAADTAGRTLVVLLDISASMQSTDVAPSRFEAGRDAVRRLIDGLGAEDRMLLVALGSSATPMGPMSSDPAVLRGALDAIANADTAANLRAGLELTADVLHEASRPEVVVVTDGATPTDEGGDAAEDIFPPSVRLSWVRVGVSDENVGIASFAVRRYPLDKTQSEVLIELWNPSERARSIELTLLGDGRAVDVRRLDLGPGERLRRFFGDLSGADTALEARIRPTDGRPDYLAADDHAFARLPPRRRARVEVVSDGNLYLEAALLLDEYLDVHHVTPADYDPDGPYDVLIFDRWVPDGSPRKPALYLAPAAREGGAAPFEVLGTLERPFFDRVDRHHPLTRFAALRDVNIADALALRPAQGDHVVASDRGGPLLVEGHRAGVPIVALAFDVRHSDLPLRVAWPILLLHTIDFFVESERGFRSSYETGETWYVPVPAGATEATVIRPDGREVRAPVVDGRAVFSGERAGFYTVRAGDVEALIAANLGPGDETQIKPGDALRVANRQAGEASAGTGGARQPIWALLAALVLAVLMLEWVLYHRRWTV